MMSLLRPESLFSPAVQRQALLTGDGYHPPAAHPPEFPWFPLISGEPECMHMNQNRFSPVTSLPP